MHQVMRTIIPIAKGILIKPLPNLFEDVGADLVEAMYICFPFCCATCHSTSLLAALDRENSSSVVQKYRMNFMAETDSAQMI